MARQIVVDIIGDAKNFTRATEDASKASSGFGNTIKHVAEVGAGAFLALGTAAIGFGIHAIEHMADAGQAAYEMSEKFGILPQQASQWMSVAKQLGVDSDT